MGSSGRDAPSAALVKTFSNVASLAPGDQPRFSTTRAIGLHANLEGGQKGSPPKTQPPGCRAAVMTISTEPAAATSCVSQPICPLEPQKSRFSACDSQVQGAIDSNG